MRTYSTLHRVTAGKFSHTNISITANVRTTNSEDAVWTQQNGSYGALNMYYVEDQDITQGIIAFLNLAVVSSLPTLKRTPVLTLPACFLLCEGLHRFGYE